MAKKETRFIKTMGEASWAGSNEIWVDRETGVNYLYHSSGNSGGLTPLLDRQGKPIITTVFDEE